VLTATTAYEKCSVTALTTGKTDARSQLILCGNFLIYLFLLASDQSHIEAAYQLLQDFHHALKRLGETTHKPGRLLLRPVRLRLDSFFRQAATILRGNDGL
jgi:hypothetical protein